MSESGLPPSGRQSGAGGSSAGGGPLQRNVSGLSLNSHAAASLHRRNPSAKELPDRSAYAAGQSLSAVVNDPRADHSRGWGAWLGLNFKVPDTSWQEPPPPVDTMRYPPISMQQLQGYLSILGDGKFNQFLADRTSMQHGTLAQQLQLVDEEGSDDDAASSVSSSSRVVSRQHTRHRSSVSGMSTIGGALPGGTCRAGAAGEAWRKGGGGRPWGAADVVRGDAGMLLWGEKRDGRGGKARAEANC